MSTIGADIKDALADAGGAFTILREAGNVSEYGTYLPTSQATKPITLEHFRHGALSYDTDVVAGDVIEFDKTSERFLAMNKLPLLSGDAITNYESVFYKCNISDGVLFRPSGEATDAQYHTQTLWDPIKSDCDAMQVAALYGNSLEDEEEMALIGLRKDEVYIQHSVGAQALDRFQPASGEYYQVSTVETRRFPGVDVLRVEEDHR